jgi:hypothetical protein
MSEMKYVNAFLNHRSFENFTKIQNISLLPDVMVHFLAAVPVLSMYRKILAADLLGDQKETQKHSLQSTVEPGVTLVPHLLDSNDFARLLISVWDKKRRVMKSTDKVYFNPFFSCTIQGSYRT